MLTSFLLNTTIIQSRRGYFFHNAIENKYQSQLQSRKEQILEMTHYSLATVATNFDGRNYVWEFSS